ncbi:uncharacterized protein L203_106450 [Cryptococcus depauperatus CBS 7841]|uniref:Uncharacterized protein n=1 Tax=Cryptococcus depauperatus CBS 7841 TaxID=1295531 RepID=A0AAJ8JZ45_9TREE
MVERETRQSWLHQKSVVSHQPLCLKASCLKGCGSSTPASLTEQGVVLAGNPETFVALAVGISTTDKEACWLGWVATRPVKVIALPSGLMCLTGFPVGRRR